MSLLQTIILAVVQGLTEFLPISSSGHLVIASWLFDWPDQGLTFDAAVHVGTLGAVLLYFRSDWATLVRGGFTGGEVRFGDGSDEHSSMRARRFLLLLAIGTVPLVIVGLALKGLLEDQLRSPESAALFLLGTAVILTLAELLGSRTRRLMSARFGDAAVVGLAQAAAVVPGISRSGITIAAGMAVNMTRQSAARFSFFLAVPALIGSGLLVIADAAQGGFDEGTGWDTILIGAAVSCVTGYLAIAGLLRLLRTRSLKPFIAYTFLAGTAVLILRAAGV